MNARFLGSALHDAYGNKVSMTTYRNESSDGDTTRWFYDEPSGYRGSRGKVVCALSLP